MVPKVAGSSPVDRPNLRCPLSHLQALILGIIQGLTEFFPISSSAHLKMARWLLGVSLAEEGQLFDLVCHLGTLLALVFHLRKEVLAVLLKPAKIGLFSLALFPLIPAYFLLKPFYEALSKPEYLGYFFSFTALLLFSAVMKTKRQKAFLYASYAKEATDPLSPFQKTFDVLCIGMVQALALIPGISRSGSTIAVARLRGWSWVQAARFSFLLSIPAILGGEFLEIVKWVKKGSFFELSFPCYLWGFTASLATGLIAVRCMFWIYEKERVLPFAWYCLGMGIFAWMVL